MESDSHALKTGLFLLAACALLFLTLVVFGDRSPPSRPYLIYTGESVAGLAQESRVYYKGVEVGRVREIGFDEESFDQVRVLIAVDESIPLGENTFAQLTLRGITGEYDLTLDNDGPLGDPLPRRRGGEPPVIPMRTQYIVRLGESLEQVLSEVTAVTENLRELTAQDNRERVSAILDGAARAIDRFVALQDRFEGSITELPDALAGIEPALADFGAAMDEIRSTARTLSTRTVDLDPLIGRMREAATSLNQLLRSMQGETLLNVDETLEALRLALRQLADLAEALRRDPQSILLGPPPQRLGPGEGEGGP